MNPNPNLRAHQDWTLMSSGCLECGEPAVYYNEFSGEQRCNQCGYSFGGDQ